MLRIGRIEYANCTPIFRSLLDNGYCGDYQLVGGVPAKLNAMLAAGMIDICPSSSIEFAINPERYLILPNLSISSFGAVGSVLLFSHVPLEELDNRDILLSSESATSVNLLKIILEKRFGCSCNYRVAHNSLFKENMLEAPAMLLIGDSALRTSMLKSGLHVYDLGQLWQEWTGLPFVFALWLCRLQIAEERFAEVDDLAKHLIMCKKYAMNNLESIAKGSPEALWMGVDRLVAYWSENISFDLDDLHLEGLTLFYKYCAELKLLPAEPELHFLESYQQKEI